MSLRKKKKIEMKDVSLYYSSVMRCNMAAIMIESWLVHDHLRVALKAWHSCPLHRPLAVGRQLG